jgi:hypothetical protein
MDKNASNYCKVITLLMIVLTMAAGCATIESTPAPTPLSGTPFPPTATVVSSSAATMSSTVTPMPPTPTTVVPTATQTQGPTSTFSPLPSEISPAGGVFFVESGQRLGDMRSWDVDLGDLDGDGDLDAFVANDQRSQVWLNDGHAVFTQGEQRTKTVSGLRLGDLDQDGDLDAVAVNTERSCVIWLNDGSGTFTTGQRMPDGVTGYGVELGDVDADGDLDAYIARDGLNMLWLNDGHGELTDSGQRFGENHPVNDISIGAVLADLDGDGDLDAFMTNTGGSDAGSGNTIWLNDGHGTFFDSGLRLGHAYSLGVALGDLDGDGDLDAFVTNSYFSNPSVDTSNRVWLNVTP